MKRMVRVNELLKRELGTIIERNIDRDTNCLITVTSVNTAPDLRQASVYISLYGEKGRQQNAMQQLREKRIEIQNTLSKTVRLKYTPILHFYKDDRFEKADRIYKILDNLNLENDQSPPEDKE